MLDRLFDFAVQNDSENRHDLLRSISDLSYNNGREHTSEAEVGLFAEVAGPVLGHPTKILRAMFSARAASDPRTQRLVRFVKVRTSLAAS